MDAHMQRLFEGLFSKYLPVHRRARQLINAKEKEMGAATVHWIMQRIPKRSLLEEEWMFESLATIVNHTQALWRIWNARWPGVPMPTAAFGQDWHLEADYFHDREYVDMVLTRFPEKTCRRGDEVITNLLKFGDLDLARRLSDEFYEPVLRLTVDELLAMSDGYLEQVAGLAHRVDVASLIPPAIRWRNSHAISLEQIKEDPISEFGFWQFDNFIRYAYPIIPEAEKRQVLENYAKITNNKLMLLHPIVCFSGCQTRSQWNTVMDLVWRGEINQKFVGDSTWGGWTTWWEPIINSPWQRTTFLQGCEGTVRRGFLRPTTTALAAFTQLDPDLIASLGARAFGATPNSQQKSYAKKMQIALKMLGYASKYLADWPFPG